MIRCIKCREEHEGDHVCVEEMTLDELFNQSLQEVRDRKSEAIREGFKTMEGAAKVISATPCLDMRKSKATVPPGQSHDDDGFKP